MHSYTEYCHISDAMLLCSAPLGTGRLLGSGSGATYGLSRRLPLPINRITFTPRSIKPYRYFSRRPGRGRAAARRALGRATS